MHSKCSLVLLAVVVVLLGLARVNALRIGAASSLTDEGIAGVVRSAFPEFQRDLSLIHCTAANREETTFCKHSRCSCKISCIAVGWITLYRFSNIQVDSLQAQNAEVLFPTDGSQGLTLRLYDFLFAAC